MNILILLGVLVCLILMARGIFLAAFRKGRRKAGLLWTVLSPVAAIGLLLLGSEIDARREGWPSFTVKVTAEKAGITDPAAWAEFAAMDEARKAEAKAALARTEARAKQEADAKAAAEQADFRRKGFHCLSAWSGHSDSFVDAVKAQMRDPDSFEPIETRIGAVDGGKHPVVMKYRARNGFGGMNVAEAAGVIDTETCIATVLLVE